MAKKHTDSALGVLEMVASVVESLHEEMTDWQSNLEGNSMEHLPKYEQVSECVDALDNAEVRNPVDELETLLGSRAAGETSDDLVQIDLGAVMVTYEMSTAKRQSRADRLGEAQDCMERALSALEERLAVLKEQDAERVKAAEAVAAEDEEVEGDERLDEIESLLADLRQALDSLADVQFPGMYG